MQMNVLIILTRFPFIEKQFHEFNYHGDILKPDGEYFARKVSRKNAFFLGQKRRMFDIFYQIFIKISKTFKSLTLPERCHLSHSHHGKSYFS